MRTVVCLAANALALYLASMKAARDSLSDASLINTLLAAAAFCTRPRLDAVKFSVGFA